MKNIKRDSGPKAPENILERAGNGMGGDCWLKIGLSRRELALVTRLAKDYKFTRSPSAAMARRLVMMALANLPIIERSWNAMVKYCDAENICLDSFLDARAHQVLNSLGEVSKNA